MLIFPLNESIKDFAAVGEIYASNFSTRPIALNISASPWSFTLKLQAPFTKELTISSFVQ